MSVIKLLSRIKAPSDLEMLETLESSGELSNSLHAHLHDHTYGITSDPLTQFACAFAALIHDVDHEGEYLLCVIQGWCAICADLCNLCQQEFQTHSLSKKGPKSLPFMVNEVLLSRIVWS